MTSGDVPLVARYGRRLTLNEPTTAVVWAGAEAWFALGDGTVRIAAGSDELRVIEVHVGAVLCAAQHPSGGIVTGGDDGRLVHVATDGSTAELGCFGTKWVEHVAASPGSGVIVASAGKEAIVWTRGATAPSHRFAFASTVGGLALDAKGKRLGVAHYGGATLLYAANAGSGRVGLRWDGSHIACTLHPAGDYLVTGCQETGLHGWKLPIAADMRMSGYKAKTRSFSWNRRAKWLATSGDDRAILWPFDGKTGPMGRAPLLLGDRGSLVTQVAFHPQQDMLAVGYADGGVALVRVEDDAYSLVEDARGAAVTALAWDGAGACLAYADEAGRAGILDMRKRA